MRIYRGQFLDVIVGSTERRESDFLRELRKRRVGKQRNVSQELVTYVRFGRVQRSAVVPDVLRGMEHPERQSRQEVPGRQQPSDRPQREPGAVCNVAPLRYRCVTVVRSGACAPAFIKGQQFR